MKMHMLVDVCAVIPGPAAISSSDRFRLEDCIGSVRAVQAALRLLLACKLAAHASTASLASKIQIGACVSSCNVLAGSG